jgi:hypothetical protein
MTVKVRFRAMTTERYREYGKADRLSQEVRALMIQYAQRVVKWTQHYPAGEWEQREEFMRKHTGSYLPKSDYEGVYKRTRRLLHSWHIKPKWNDFKGWIVEIYNDATDPKSGTIYSSFVHGDDQQSWAEERGWRKLSDGFHRFYSGYRADLMDIYRRWAQRCGGG